MRKCANLRLGAGKGQGSASRASAAGSMTLKHLVAAVGLGLIAA
jgi:hypothetical protein